MWEVDLIKNIDFIMDMVHYFYNSGADGSIQFSDIEPRWGTGLAPCRRTLMRSIEDPWFFFLRPYYR
jgi:hypothetical protein